MKWFNVMLTRNHAHSVKPATTAICTRLMDKTRSGSDTIMTAMMMLCASQINCGQAKYVFINDQQLQLLNLYHDTKE